MSPEQFLKIEADQEAIISAARKVIGAARDESDEYPPPVNLRPARVEDLKAGAVVWLRLGIPNGTSPEWVWQQIEKAHKAPDASSAYTARDGCVYGLWNTFVEQTHPDLGAPTKKQDSDSHTDSV